MRYRWWVLVAILLFAAGIASGWMTSAGTTNALLVEELRALEQLSQLFAPYSPLTAVLIFVNNATKLVMSFVLSPIFCLAPILVLTVNGLLLGFLSPVIIDEESLGFLLAGVLPHGVFEISALILGLAAAFNYGVMTTFALLNKDGEKRFMPILRHNVRYLLIALILLIPGAIIETYLTPTLLGQ